MSPARVAWIDDPIFEGHLQHDLHPESPKRVRAIRDALQSSGLDARLLRIPVREASLEELALVHRSEYIAQVQKACAQAPAWLGHDVIVGTGSWKAALSAAGAALEGIRAILDGRVERVFGNIRPPGHHARPDEAMGFCIFNNIALAARWATARGGLDRVAILDWDLHHGNGSEEIFWDDPKVFYASLHQHPFYPGSGRERRRTNSWNLELPAGSGDQVCLQRFDSELLPALKAFEPQVLFVSCGFDALASDPLGQLQWSPAIYGELSRRCLDLGKGRLLSLLEGGYDLKGLGEAAQSHVLALLESP